MDTTSIRSRIHGRRRSNERFSRLSQTGEDGTSGDVNPFSQVGNRFAEADLIAELAELTRQANRANASLYTIDPRGLVGGPDLDEKIDMVEWQNYVTASQNSLRTLAELTGGIAVVSTNDFTKALKRIDAETSDYYVVGYYSNNPDPMKKRRKIEVKSQPQGAERLPPLGIPPASARQAAEQSFTRMSWRRWYNHRRR